MGKEREGELKLFVGKVVFNVFKLFGEILRPLQRKRKERAEYPTEKLEYIEHHLADATLRELRFTLSTCKSIYMYARMFSYGHCYLE